VRQRRSDERIDREQEIMKLNISKTSLKMKTINGDIESSIASELSDPSSCPRLGGYRSTNVNSKNMLRKFENVLKFCAISGPYPETLSAKKIES